MESYGHWNLHNAQNIRFQKHQKSLGFKANHAIYRSSSWFIQIGEVDPNAFSYGIMFRYPTSQTIFMLKITCYVNGKASIHLKSSEVSGS